MQLCSLNIQYAMQATSDSASIDWSEYAQSLPQHVHVVREAPSWVTSHKACSYISLSFHSTPSPC